MTPPLLSLGQIEIGILKGFASTVKNQNGTCSWRVTAPGSFMNVSINTSPEKSFEGTDGADGLIWKCFVEDEIRLFAVIKVYGKVSHCTFL